MKRAILLLLAVSAAASLAVLRLGGPDAGQASSHREAPLIADDPGADSTDLYAFRSPDRPDTVTLLANYIPGEDPAAGPNWYTFSPNVRYYLHVDQGVDGKPDISYRFTFQRGAGQFFLGNTVQDYTVQRIAGGQTQTVATGKTPPNNIGPKSTPNYRTLAANAVTQLSGGGLAFAGQREDAFFGDIGSIFDLVNLRKFPPNQGGGKDFFAGYAVHAIALQIPIQQLDDADHTIGVWTSAERQSVQVRTVQRRIRVRVGKRTVTRTVPTQVVTRPWVQVSRLGNPLVNEVVIPTNRKDEWNGDTPDEESKYASFYSQPILAAVLNSLFPGVLNVPEQNRDDLVAVLLTGVPGLNSTGSTQAEMLRLNLSTPVSANPHRLGVFGGDNQGWPNGRRLTDDVIDIAEQAVVGKLKGNAVADVIGDGVNANDVASLGSFPYEADPPSGFDNTKGQQKP
jgi:Domain of unknown function (DUF4331)